MFRNIFKKIPRKTSGATLLATLVLSGLLLGILLALSKVVADEVQFTGEVTRSERAYFSAESGVEVSLLKLAADPVLTADFEIADTVLIRARNRTTIQNLITAEESESFQLQPSESQKMRLRINRDGVIVPTDVSELRISAEIPDEFVEEALQWQILCNEDNRVLSIQALTGELESVRFGAMQGTVDFFDAEIDDFSAEKNVSVSRFWQRFVKNDETRQQCFLSLKNLAAVPLEMTLSGADFAPPTGNIRSVGQTGDQQKIIEFQYSQKALAPVFDFGILVTD